MAGKTIRTETLVKALKAEWSIQQSLSKVSSQSQQDRAYGAMQSLKELAHRLGVYDRMFTPDNENEPVYKP